MDRLHKRIADFLTLFDIEIPIIQGGMAWVSDFNLVSAVSRAGGLGTIAAGHMPAEILAQQISEVKARTSNTFAVNMMLINPDVEEQMEVVIESQVPVVILGAGNAAAYVDKFHNHNIKVIGIPPSVALAKRLAKSGIDAVIPEGSEAGGHIGRFSTMVLLPAVVDALSSEGYDIPVIAAGGICDGRSMLASFILGASAVQVGSVLVPALETNVHQAVKDAYIRANDVTKVIVTGQAWGLPAQCLKNSLTKEIDEYEREFIARGKTAEAQEEIELRIVGKLREAMQEGNVKTGSVMAGQSVIRIPENYLNLPAADILSDLMEQFRSVLDSLRKEVI